MKHVALKLILLFFFFVLSETNAQQWQQVAEKLPTPYSQNVSHKNFGREIAIDGNYAVIGGNDFIQVFHYNDSVGLWEFEAKLWMEGETINTNFGPVVAIHGNTIVAGATGANGGAGAAFVYEKNGPKWENGAQTARLTPLGASVGHYGSRFGSAVSIYEDYITVGAVNKTISSIDGVGAAFIYQKPVGGWVDATQNFAFTSPLPELHQNFAVSLDIWKETLIVGAWGTGDNSGVAYLYDLNAQSQLGVLHASDSTGNDRFGNDVAIDSNQIVIGALQESANQGAAYVFVEPITGWTTATETAKLTVSGGVSGDMMGFSVDVFEDHIVCGAHGENDSTGAAYIYKRPIGGWQNATETAKLSAFLPSTNAWFGGSVAIQESKILITAPFDDEHAVGAGASYFFEEPVGGWISATEDQKIMQSSLGNNNDGFGENVVVNGNISVVAAPWESNSTEAVYVYEFDGMEWVKLARLSNSDAGTGRYFGSGLAMNDSVIVVGAAEGGTGAVYVYEKPPTGWADATETAKLKASNGVAGDRFGTALAIEGDEIAVGAGNAGGSGKVYVYEKNGVSWASASEVAILSSSVTPVIGLGISVDMHDGIIIAGAPVSSLAAPVAGAVFLYEKPISGWTTGTESSYFVSQNPTVGAFFGRNVAIYDSVVTISDLDGSTSTYGSVTIIEKVAGTWTQTARLFNQTGALGGAFATNLSLHENKLAVSIGTYVVIYSPDSNGVWSDTTGYELLSVQSSSTIANFAISAISIGESSLVVGSDKSSTSCKWSGEAVLYSNSILTQISESSCGPYTSPSGQVYLQTGIYLDTIQSQSGMDSVLNIDLTVVNVNFDLTSTETTVSELGINDGTTMVSSGSGMMDLSYSLDGITFQNSGTFTNLAVGDYVCYAMDSMGCLDTIAFSILLDSTLSVADLNESNLSVYPNPSVGIIHIAGFTSPHIIEVYNLQGKLVSRQSGKNAVFTTKLDPGSYYIRISDLNFRKTVQKHVVIYK